MIYKASPLPDAIQSCCFQTAPNTVLSRMLQATLVFVEKYPHLLHILERDLDRHAREKKAIRLENERERLLIMTPLPGMPEFDEPYEASKLKLGSGRKRMPVRMLMVYYVLRGLWGGSKGSWVNMLQGESRSLEILKEMYGWPDLKPSALEENLNAIGMETREEIHRCLLEWIQKEGLDDMELLMVDSTAAEANSCWPTDSGILGMLMRQCVRHGEELKSRRQAEDWVPDESKELLQQVKNKGFEINCQKGKKTEKAKKKAEEIRKSCYEEILEISEYVSQWYGDRISATEEEVKTRKWNRSERKLREKLAETVRKLDGQIEATYRRLEVEEEEEKGKAELERTYSVDPDARMIVKGGRVPVVGYKPQAAVSGKGFVIAIKTFLGNTADSKAVKPMLELYKKYVSKEKPGRVTFDDGYTSAENLEYLTELEIDEISFSGSKGKKLMKEAYEGEEIQKLRNKRSHIEAVIFQLKDMVGLGRMRRRGLENIEMEIMEKIIAFNLWRMQMT